MRRLLPLLLFAVSAHAASEYPPHYRWRTITTDHFLVHFHQGEDELAQHAASIAERAHARLTPLLGWTPAERTHLILTDHVDVSNGSATPFPLNRIEVYVSAPGADPSSPLEYYDNWLNLVITHEYAHILHLDQARAFSGGMRRVFGRNPYFGFPNLWSPLWLTEGLATLIESETTQAGRLKGTFVDMILRTAAIEGRFASEGQAGGLTPYWPGGNARYYYGSKFLSWLAQQRGADKLREYINEYSSNIVPFRVNATADDVYGTTMASLWREWTAAQQAEYRREHDALVSQGLTSRERLTSFGYETKYPLLSPDGARIAYAHEGPFERPTIRVREVSSGRDIDTLEVNNASALSWSSDGTRIAFSQLEFVGSFSVLSDLYIWTVGGDTKRVTRGARLKDPAFTPEGSLIAVENRGGRNRIVEVDVASGNIRALVEPVGFTQFSEPAVSHDGGRIAVAEWNDGAIDVVVYSRDGARITNLTSSMTRATSGSPRFSRDDNTIFFSSDATGIPNIYTVASGGGEVRRITNVYGGAFYPTSADGRRFFYSDYSSEGFDVAMFDATRTYPATLRTVPESVMGMTSSPIAQAPAVLRESSTYSALRSLRPRWWFPVIGDDSIGATTSGGDVLGFHTYTISATAGDDAQYGVVYNYDRLYPTITAGAFRYDQDDDELRQRLIAQISFPFRRFRWQTSVWGGLISDDVANVGQLQGFRAGAVFNNSREYGFSVSREDGFTARVDYENLDESFGSDASLQQIRGDLRGYLSIPYARAPLGRHVLAARVAAARQSGDVIRQRELRVGGTDDLGFPGLDVEELPVRGYDEGTLRGRTASIASLEYRFPLWQIDRGPTTLPLFFNRLVGDVFVDAGRAGGSTIASTGAEAGLDLVLGYALSLRYRLGIAYRLRDPGKGEAQFFASVGTAF